MLKRVPRQFGGKAFSWSVVLAIACVLAPTAAGRLAASNDNFGSAADLTGSTASVTASNVGASKEPGEPNHAGDPGGHSVWWRWIAPTTDVFTVQTCDSDFDTLLGVYVGAGVGALSTVASSDDACDFASSASFRATNGQTYYIAVDGRDEDQGTIKLKLQPTLSVAAQTITRRQKIDATRLSIEVARPGDEDDAAPRLVFVSGSKRLTIDLELDTEGDPASETAFRYTFDWLCGRAGTWHWTVSATRGGQTAASQGSVTVPRCVRSPWYVSRAKVVADFATDFGRGPARWLRCQAAGARQGSLAAIWRCTMVQPGYRCTGGFLFRYSKVNQAGDIVAKSMSPSGGVTCKR